MKNFFAPYVILSVSEESPRAMTKHMHAKGFFGLDGLRMTIFRKISVILSKAKDLSYMKLVSLYLEQSEGAGIKSFAPHVILSASEESNCAMTKHMHAIGFFGLDGLRMTIFRKISVILSKAKDLLANWSRTPAMGFFGLNGLRMTWKFYKVSLWFFVIAGCRGFRRK